MKQLWITLTIVFSLSIFGNVYAGNSQAVKPGDILDISVEDQPHMDTTVIVSPKGIFYYRYSGEVAAEGLSLAEITEAVSTLIKQTYPYLDNPKVKVSFRGQPQTQSSGENLFLEEEGRQAFEPEETSLKLTEASYRIGPNDKLNIAVYDEPELNRTVIVSENGTIVFPFMGEIKVIGFTPNEVAKKIGDILGTDYLVNPQVSVSVAEYAKFFILGAVKNEGSYEAKGNLTLIDALALAGGAKPEADLSQIKVIRQETEGAKEIILDIETEGKLFFIKPKDRIIVQQYGKFSVLGAVNQPGNFDFKTGFTLIDALALAGGAKAQADLSKIKLIRKESGEPKEIILDLDIEGKSFFLKPTDSIVIPEYGKISILGEVKNPGSYYFKKNLGVVELIAIAGGFTDLANKNGVQVVRGQGPGKEVIKVPVANILKSGDKSKDVMLQENDTVIVPETLF